MAIIGKCFAWLWVAIMLIFTIAALASSFILTGSLFAFAALIAMPIAPFRRIAEHLNIQPEYRLAGTIVAGVVGLIALVNVLPPPPNARSPAAAPIAALAPETSEPQPNREVERKQRVRAEFRAVFRQSMALAKPCDRANSAAADALQDNMYAAYDAAETAQSACEDSWLQLERLAAPESMTDAEQEKAAKALEYCSGAYYLRKKSLDTLVKVIDGDDRPSMVSEYAKDAKAAQAGTMLCVGHMMQIGNEVGVSMDELSKLAEDA